MGAKAFEHTQLVITPIEYDESYNGTLTMDEVLTILAGDQARDSPAASPRSRGYDDTEGVLGSFESAFCEALEARY